MLAATFLLFVSTVFLWGFIRGGTEGGGGHGAIQAAAAAACTNEAPGAGGLSGYYLGWLRHDNLGDELLLGIYMQLLQQAMQEEFGGEGATVMASYAVAGGPKRPLQPGTQPDFVVLGGGSMLTW